MHAGSLGGEGRRCGQTREGGLAQRSRKVAVESNLQLAMTVEAAVDQIFTGRDFAAVTSSRVVFVTIVTCNKPNNSNNTNADCSNSDNKGRNADDVDDED